MNANIDLNLALEQIDRAWAILEPYLGDAYVGSWAGCEYLIDSGLPPVDVLSVQTCVCVTAAAFIGATAAGIDPLRFARAHWDSHWGLDDDNPDEYDLGQAAWAHAIEIGMEAVERKKAAGGPG